MSLSTLVSVEVPNGLVCFASAIFRWLAMIVPFRAHLS